MRRLAGALLALPLLLAAAAEPPQPVSAKPAPAPKIRVEPDGFDFGRTRPRSMLRKQFVLRNVGERELVLQRPSTSCSCTAAILGDLKLKPGGSTLLNVELSTGASAGAVERRVLVPSNDPKTPLLALTLRATVEAPAKE